MDVKNSLEKIRLNIFWIGQSRYALREYEAREIERISERLSSLQASLSQRS